MVPCMVSPLGALATRLGCREQQQERRQHHHPHHFCNHRRAGGLGAHGRASGHHLRDLVHRGAHVQAVVLRVGVQPAVFCVPLEQRRVQKSAQGAEHHHRGNGHRHVLRPSFGDWRRGQYGGGTANGTACADQQGGAPVQPQHTLAQPTGQAEGAGQYQRVGSHAAPADLRDVLERQAQAVQHDACPQELLLCQGHAGAAGPRQARVHRVAQQQASDDGQRQCAQAVPCEPGLLRQPQRTGGDGAAHGQPGRGMDEGGRNNKRGAQVAEGRHGRGRRANRPPRHAPTVGGLVIFV